MQWVEQFYAKQNAWSGVYSGGPEQHHHDTAQLVLRLAGDGVRHVLELGAGGGQNAAALAGLGVYVAAVELVSSSAENARMLAAELPSGSLQVIEGDFYQIDLPQRFDAVCYWDGFGIGTDADQRRLLRRIAQWLKPNAKALIEISTPWYWAAASGRHMVFDIAQRRYAFDVEGCRLLDTWWSTGDEASAVTQSLRCYSPADLRLLLEGTGLQLDAVESRGAYDADQQRFDPNAPLAEAMAYLAVLKRNDT